MKKQLKDITVGELFNRCGKAYHCNGCPFWYYQHCTIEEVDKEDLDKEFDLDDFKCVPNHGKNNSNE